MRLTSSRAVMLTISFIRSATQSKPARPAQTCVTFVSCWLFDRRENLTAKDARQTAKSAKIPLRSFAALFASFAVKSRSRQRMRGRDIRCGEEEGEGEQGIDGEQE